MGCIIYQIYIYITSGNYDIVIGNGGRGGLITNNGNYGGAGNNGQNSSISINSAVYIANGGGGAEWKNYNGKNSNSGGYGGSGGFGGNAQITNTSNGIINANSGGLGGNNGTINSHYYYGSNGTGGYYYKRSPITSKYYYAGNGGTSLLINNPGSSITGISTVYGEMGTCTTRLPLNETSTAYTMRDGITCTSYGGGSGGYINKNASSGKSGVVIIRFLS